MKIVIDISRLHSLALKRGVGFYSLNLFKALKRLNDGNDYLLKRAKEEEFAADLIHYPYFDPFFLTMPLVINKPFIATIHDLIPLKSPNCYPRGLKGELKWQIQKQLVKRSKAIITDSVCSKKDIIKIIGYPQNQIYPIYLAASEEFKKLTIDSWQLEVSKKYSLPKYFLLYVGDLNWNKNVKGLTEAFYKLKVKSEKLPARIATQSVAGGKVKVNNLKLILIGSVFENKQLEQLKQLDKLIKKLDLEDKVIKLGFVPTDDLVKIYNLAALYIQPSFYEGFGLPVLEAMSCGCPVLSSNQSSLQEVGGKAVEYFNPYDQDQLSNKLLDLLIDKHKLLRLSDLGLRQAKKFSWQKTALETKKVYEKILVRN